jgi:polyferredoxin
MGFLIAKYTRVRATLLLWFYLVLVLLSTVISLFLPQANSLIYLSVGVGAGTLISIAIVLGLMTQVGRKK